MGRHLAGFTAGAGSSVFHRLKERTGKQAEKEVGGRTTQGRRRGSLRIEAHSKLELGKVQPSLGHLTDDRFCHLYSETLTLGLSSSPPQSETDFHTEVTPVSGRFLIEGTNICMREGDRISVPYFKIFFKKKAREATNAKVLQGLQKK